MKDGGPAFPRADTLDQMGMTLLQYYAGEAMRSLMLKYETSTDDCIEHMDFIAQGSLKMAQAMLKAQEEG